MRANSVACNKFKERRVFMSAVLSKVLAVFFTVVSIFLPAQPENAELTVRQVTTQSSSLTFELKNNTGRIISRPLAVLIEKQDENGQWQKADTGFGYNEIFYNLYPGQSTTEGIILTRYPEEEFCNLSEGLYRLTVQYTVVESVLKEKSVTVNITAEFTVIEA